LRRRIPTRERLAQADPDNAGWRRDLSVSHSKLGNACLKMDCTAEAAEAPTAGRAIIAELRQKGS